MKFHVSRSTQGAVSQGPPCRGAVRGPESPAWAGEYQWYIDLDSLEALMRFVADNDGGVGLFTPEEGEEYPVLQIFDEEE